MAIAFAVALFTGSLSWAAPAPTLQYDGSTCPLQSDFNIKGLVAAFEKSKDQIKLPNARLEYIDGDALVAFDKAMQAAGGPPLPDNIKGLVFMLYDGWDASGQNPVQMFLFDAHGCFLAGKLVPSEFVTKGLGASA
jgi:hypothetical protein